jgi:hypothetical protein
MSTMNVGAEIQGKCGRGIVRMRIPENSSIQAGLIHALGWL